MKWLDRLRSRPALRHTARALSLVVALLAAVVISTLVVDLGPFVRGVAEREASKAIERPVHMGRLGIHVLTGRFRVDDLRIDGLHPGDRPFFTAKQIDVSLDWLPALARRPEFVITSVDMTDWQMLVEKWEGGAHNFPRFSRDEPARPPGPKRFTTTLRHLGASRGQFAYEDHEAPWSIVCRNLELTIGHDLGYTGRATFSGGVVTIQDHLPMATSMQAWFAIDGSKIHLGRIDIQSDGATSAAKGDVDLSRWPEMAYDVKSQVDFMRMRQIFFTNERWDVAGEGRFNGRFHLFKGGHDLSGGFTSDRLDLDAGGRVYAFPKLYGTLRWTPHAFDVWNAGAKVFGGDGTFAYSIKPLGVKDRPAAHFDASYSHLDLAAFTDFEELRGLRFAGAATGRNVMDWPLGRFSDVHGEGTFTILPPPGVTTMAAALTAENGRDREWGPFAPMPLERHLPIGGGMDYRFDPSSIAVENGRFATDRTHVTFQGTTAWGDRSRLGFHVVSRDWQESDEVLAGIITDFGSRTGPVAFGGRGEFDGVMTGAFHQPRVEGEFRGEHLRAWDTAWGDGAAHVVIDGGYVAVADSLIRLGNSEIRADGKFSLGYPRDDGGEEINARFRVTRHDLDPLRHAFQIDAYPVSGLLSGEFHLTGQYERPIGFGAMTIDAGTAYGEPFQTATASLRFDGAGVRMDAVTIRKAGGTVTGAAYVGWDSTYSFNADARRIPVERIADLAYPRAPLSGVAEFTANGSGTFDAPKYDVKFRVNDLFVAEEGVGQVSGSIALRGRELSGDVDVASPRLAITGTGRIALTPQADSELTFRFHDSSLDPYVRLFVPRLSPYTTAVASGSVRISGDLADARNLLVDASVDTLDMRMFDYALRNQGPIHLALDRDDVQVRELRIVGEDTRLQVSGHVALADQRIALQASGDANLGILQGFFRNVRGSGRATLAAAINGPLAKPVFSGSATIADGRVRHFSLPNSLDAINGTILFDARGIRLDDVSATMGGGTVRFGGLIGFDGYTVGELNVTARGEDMHLRYPEGVRSTVDADLSVHGTMKAPTLGGTVTVKNALWTKRLDAPGSIVDLASRRGGGGPGIPGGGDASTAVPLRFDVQVVVPSTLHVETNLVQKMVANADLRLRGTYDHPVLLGHADVERGEVIFEGRRYKLTRGSIDFTNPTRIEPFFDVEAETNVRIPGQTYRVTVSAAGTTDRLAPQISSDPPLPPADVLSLLFGTVPSGNQDFELRSRTNEVQTDILTTRATQALASPISSEVGKVVEQTFGVDTFQLSPSFIDPYATQTKSVNPSARLTIGKRISDRAYLTFSRSLNSPTNDQVIFLEYDATDRLSWIVSRNEDNQTYALEFRVRHAF